MLSRHEIVLAGDLMKLLDAKKTEFLELMSSWIANIDSEMERTIAARFYQLVAWKSEDEEIKTAALSHKNAILNPSAVSNEPAKAMAWTENDES